MTADEIRDRMIEWAEVGRSLPGRASPAEYKSSWPAFAYLFEDMVHWPQERHAENARERMIVRAAASRAAISRAEEAGRWLKDHVRDDKNRVALVQWAKFKARIGVTYRVGDEIRIVRNFTGWCRDVAGIAVRTGQRRADRAVMDIGFAHECGFTIGNGDNSVSRFDGESDTRNARLDGAVPVTAWMAPDAKPTDNPEARDMAWAAKQAERKRRMLAKLEPAEG